MADDLDQCRLPGRIKSNVLRRIAADTTERHLIEHPQAAGWQAFGEGVSIKVLHEADGIMSYLLRLAPDASLPAHRLPIDEECVVLEGEVQIGTLHVAAGGFHLGRMETGRLPVSVNGRCGARQLVSDLALS